MSNPYCVISPTAVGRGGPWTPAGGGEEALAMAAVLPLIQTGPSFCSPFVCCDFSTSPLVFVLVHEAKALGKSY